MSKTAIIKTGEKFFIKQLSESQPIKLDKVIFANINGITGDTEIDLNGSMPAPDQIVHAAPITQAGLLNDKTVVYSVILDTNVGDFSFNYIGLVNAETNTLCMVMHTDLTKKIKTAGQRQGNTITESIWLEIDNASESTGITVNAETWQIDYSKRLAGEDERIRLTNYDLYNRLTIHSGFGITKNGNQLTVSSGLAYVVGLRVEHTTETSTNIENDQSLYIDVWLTGTTTGEWSENYNLITGANLRDYHDGNFQHYVERIASVDAAGNLIVVNPKSFVTTYDHASTEKWGIIKLNSATNSVSETEAATPLAVKKTYDLASVIIDSFRPTDFESVIFSPDKKYHAVVRNDGILGFYNSHTNRLVWSIAPDGGLNDGYVNTDRVTGLDQFINQTNNNLTHAHNRISNLNNKFGITDFESAVFSGDKNYRFVVRNDGVAGVYCESQKKFVWFFTNEGWVDGLISTERVGGLDQFVRDRCVPVGIPLPWPQTTPPGGWFECNGSQFNKSWYPKLAKAYSSGYLPDLRGEFIRGWDNGKGADPWREILSWQNCAIQRHNHAINSRTSFNSSGNTSASVANGTPQTGWTELYGDHETRPRNVAFMYIVKAE